MERGYGTNQRCLWNAATSVLQQMHSLFLNKVFQFGIDCTRVLTSDACGMQRHLRCSCSRCTAFFEQSIPFGIDCRILHTQEFSTSKNGSNQESVYSTYKRKDLIQIQDPTYIGPQYNKKPTLEESILATYVIKDLVQA